MKFVLFRKLIYKNEGMFSRSSILDSLEERERESIENKD